MADEKNDPGKPQPPIGDKPEKKEPMQLEGEESPPAGEGEAANDQELDEQEAELVPKLPDHAPPDQERGERHQTGKDIATGGAET